MSAGIEQFVDRNPAVRGGRPVLKGTRHPVSLLLVQLAAGNTVESVADFFDLKPRQIYRFLRALAEELDQKPGVFRDRISEAMDEE